MKIIYEKEINAKEPSNEPTNNHSFNSFIYEMKVPKIHTSAKYSKREKKSFKESSNKNGVDYKLIYLIHFYDGI